MEDMMSEATHMEPHKMEPTELGVDKLEQFVRGWFEFFAGDPGDAAAATAPAARTRLPPRRPHTDGLCAAGKRPLEKNRGS
jgi:hypothetical protein